MDDMENIIIAVASIVSVFVAAFAIYRAGVNIQHQIKIDRYTRFVEHIEVTWALHEKLRRSVDKDEKLRMQIKIEIEQNLNTAYSIALATMDDKLFIPIDKLLNNEFSKQSKNLIYHRMRSDLYPKTKISYEKIMDRNMKVRP